MKRSLSLLLLCAGGCFAPAPPAGPAVTAEEERAIRAAGAFLLTNGYGKQPADRRALEFDALERVYVQELGMAIDTLLSLRHNTVCFPAYGILGNAGKRPGWTVFFRSTRDLSQSGRDARTPEPLGHAVDVSRDFAEIHLLHGDARLRAAEKALHPNLNECPIWLPPPNKGYEG